jgi:DNA-binding NarL/FixJ family response regulator
LWPRVGVAERLLVVVVVMRSTIIRALLVEADVREAHWVRRALHSAHAHRARVRWQVKSVKTAKAALAQLYRKGADIILMGLRSNGKSAAQLLCRMRKAAPGVPIIALSRAEDEKLLATASALGALEVLERNKSGQPQTLSGIVATGRSQTHSPEIDKLTPRELEVFALIASGKSTKEVAGHLDIAVKTAETHRTNLMRKLGVRSVSQLVRFAIRNKVVEA